MAYKKNRELERDVAMLENRAEETKKKQRFGFVVQKMVYVFGYFLVVLFVSYLAISHYLMLAGLSTAFIMLDMPNTAIAFANMGSLYFGMFLVAMLGLILIIFVKLSWRKQRGANNG